MGYLNFMKGMLMMKRVLLTMVTAVVMGFSAPAEAMSLDALEKGARVVLSYAGDEKALSDEDGALGMEVVNFVHDFYQWLPPLSLVAEKDAPRPVRSTRMLVTPEMRKPRYFTEGLLKFIAKHKPQGRAVRPGPAAPVVLAWYISQHPDSGSAEKQSMDSLLVEAFGENYPGQPEVVAEIKAALEKEEKAKREAPVEEAKPAEGE